MPILRLVRKAQFTESYIRGALQEGKHLPRRDGQT